MTTPIVIDNITDLQAIQNNPSGYYVLGANIDASEFSFTPIANFTGVLNGAGYTINGLTITLPTTQVGLVGLFGANAGTVENLELTNESVIGSGDVGGIAGQ